MLYQYISAYLAVGMIIYIVVDYGVEILSESETKKLSLIEYFCDIWIMSRRDPELIAFIVCFWIFIPFIPCSKGPKI